MARACAGMALPGQNLRHQQKRFEPATVSRQAIADATVNHPGAKEKSTSWPSSGGLPNPEVLQASPTPYRWSADCARADDREAFRTTSPTSPRRGWQ